MLTRGGHTEASVDLCRLAGLPPVGYLCEICDTDSAASLLSCDGTPRQLKEGSYEMLRFPALKLIAGKLGLPLITIADLQRYRFRRELLVRVTRLEVGSVSFSSIYNDTAIEVQYASHSGQVQLAAAPHVLVQIDGDGRSADVKRGEVQECKEIATEAGAPFLCVNVSGDGLRHNVKGKESAILSASASAEPGVHHHSSAYASHFPQPACVKQVMESAVVGPADGAIAPLCDRILAEVAQAVAAVIRNPQQPAPQPMLPTSTDGSSQWPSVVLMGGPWAIRQLRLWEYGLRVQAVTLTRAAG